MNQLLPSDWPLTFLPPQRPHSCTLTSGFGAKPALAVFPNLLMPVVFVIVIAQVN